MLDALMAVPMFPGRDGGPRGPGWFMNWLLYAWFGAIWKEELIWKTKSTNSDSIVNVACLVLLFLKNQRSLKKRIKKVKCLIFFNFISTSASYSPLTVTLQDSTSPRSLS